jgi:cell division protein FtsL
MGLLTLVLVGFVLVATGVILRRMYGVNQAKQISELQQRREALVSEQLKLQDAIRVASDRQHLTAVAQSRLNMRIPKPDQVIFLPRRQLGRDSVRP